MITGKFKFDKKHSKELLLVETDIEGKKEWHDINSLSHDFQKQLIMSNAEFERYLTKPHIKTESVNN